MHRIEKIDILFFGLARTTGMTTEYSSGSNTEIEYAFQAAIAVNKRLVHEIFVGYGLLVHHRLSAIAVVVCSHYMARIAICIRKIDK